MTTKKTEQTELKPEKFTHCDVLQDNLEEALKIVAPFAAKKTTLPVLSSALLKADAGRLAVYATNLESYAQCFIGAMPDEGFAIAVPIKPMSEVTGMLNGMVHLTVNHQIDKLIVSSQIVADKKSKKAIKQENTMLGICWEEFPIKPDCNTVVAKFLGSDLKRMIASCLFAAATDESRPILNSLCFVVTESRIVVAAADGFRLSENSMPCTGLLPGTYIIPTHLFNSLAKLIKDDNEVTMRAALKRVEHKNKDGVVEKNHDDPTTVEFATTNLIIGGQIVDGRFPDYSQIIPKNTPVKVTVDRKQMLAALKGVLVFQKQEKFKQGTIGVPANNHNIMLVESHNADLGEAKIEVEASAFEGYSVFMGFNLQYLQDAFNACTEDHVTVAFLPFYHKGDQPIKIVEGDFTHVIMPIYRGGSSLKNGSDTYVCIERPDIPDMTERELGETDGVFSVDDGPSGEFTNLLEAIEACTLKAQEQHIESHVVDNDSGLTVWEVDERLPETEEDQT